MSRINTLTAEQEALIPVYKEKWHAIATSTVPIDRDRATVAVREFYQCLGLSIPNIAFADSPLPALEKFDLDYWGSELVDFSRIEENLKKQIDDRLWIQLRRELYESSHDRLWNEIGVVVHQKLQSVSNIWQALSQGTQLYFNPVQDIIPIDYLAALGCWFDFCYSVLNCSGERELWQAYQQLVEHCGWLLAYESICIVCDRPCILSLDSQYRLHGEGQPAILFNDGFGISAYQGVELPEKYARVHPMHWRSQWLLEEKNAELKRILIQGIGYDRICQEFNAIELDCWQEYRLLKIDSSLDVEPIHLLAMTCPSTEHPHALRVPPNMTSARQAIRWANWDIDPNEFDIQT